MVLKKVRSDYMGKEENYDYPDLDDEIIKRNSSHIISYEEAVKDVIPFAWTDEVLSGQKKVVVK